MSEYARFNGREVKIGTCEEMYYLRRRLADAIERERRERVAQAVRS